MKKILIEVSDDIYDTCVSEYNYGTPFLSETVIARGKVLSEMTNGEVYEEVFDNFDNIEDVEVYAHLRFEEDDWKGFKKNTFSKTWWNAPFVKGLEE